ncbi:RagB/SusD family nutrient uptake outer membrane protein [Chitinophaga sp.]|uniref:RagB/SusD family nutrient uptake outer membrane protein n=1 Tax=Chitinophaga sp. TaxID=1869181 RepID=UPI002625D811|nr:RagB/SusD family nutrient uptake outer membrane protein [uncultured Chitinophaga sp.]
MMKRNILSIIAGAALLLASCNNFLDITPKGYTIPEKFGDYEKLLNNLSLSRAASAYPNYLTDDVQAGLNNDVSKSAGFNRYAAFKQRMYRFDGGQIMDMGAQDSQWEPSYQHIYVYNTVINNVMDVTDATDREKRRVRAEALVGRAFEYLLLVNLYAKHYDPATAATDFGVPMVLSEDINVPYERVSVAAVYDQIKKDLDMATPDLSEKVPNNFHPLKSVGFAFLSRMYLYMGDYEKALGNANEALKRNATLIDYKNYVNIEGTTFGRVCLPADSTGFPNADLNPESVWIRLGSASNGTMHGEVYAPEDLIATYAADLAPGATDMRFQLFFCHGSSKFGSGSSVKFPGRELWAPYIEFNTGLSSPEVILIAAECEARVGDKNKALAHLNTLRDMRIKGNQPLVAATKDEALRIVLDERRRELRFIGPSRLIDLKRLNKDPRFAKTVTHKHESETWTLAPNDNRYILPVPPRVLAMNPGIPQYDR